jgi:hypothetical protein
MREEVFKNSRSSNHQVNAVLVCTRVLECVSLGPSDKIPKIV